MLAQVELGHDKQSESGPYVSEVWKSLSWEINTYLIKAVVVLFPEIRNYICSAETVTNSHLVPIRIGSIFSTLNLAQITEFDGVAGLEAKERLLQSHQYISHFNTRDTDNQPLSIVWRNNPHKRWQSLCFPILLKLAGTIRTHANMGGDTHANMWGDTHKSNRRANESKCFSVSTMNTSKSWKVVCKIESEANGPSLLCPSNSHCSRPVSITGGPFFLRLPHPDLGAHAVHFLFLSHFEQFGS